MRRFFLTLGLPLLLVAALVSPVAARTDTTSAELPSDLRDLIVRFYQAVSLEPGATFDSATARAITAEPLQSVLLADLESTAASLLPDTYYRYLDVRIVSGSCTGDGGDQVCEFAVNRVLATNHPDAQAADPRGNLRFFRAKQIAGEWKLFDTRMDGSWLSDLQSAEIPEPRPANLGSIVPAEPRPLVVPAAPEQLPGKRGAAPGQIPNQAESAPPGWVTHEQLAGGYAISLPPDWTVPEEDVFADPDTVQALDELGIETPFLAAAREAFALVLIWRMQPDAPAQDLQSEIESDIDPDDLDEMDVHLEENDVELPAGRAAEVILSVQPRDPSEPHGFVAVLYRLDRADLSYQLAFAALTNRGDVEGPVQYLRRMAQTFRFL